MAVVASAMMVLFVIHAEANGSSASVVERGWCGDNAYYYYYSDGTLEIGGSGAMYDYDGSHAPWYGDRAEITRIVIDNDITYLGKGAFLECASVKELVIPISLNSVTSDTDCAFAGCCNIEKVGFTYGADGYGFNYTGYKGQDSWYQLTPWYQSRDVLKDIEFAELIKSIGTHAFRELNITSLVLPESMASLGCYCFADCTKLADLTIPEHLNPYGDMNYPAFQGCLAVEKVTFTRGNGIPFGYSDSVGTLYQYLAPWNMNNSIAKTIVISDNITLLGGYMFTGCNIRELTIPIGAYCGSSNAFFAYDSSCYSSLEKVTLTKGTGILCNYDAGTSRYNPWNNAPNLKTVTLEEGITRLGDYVFYSCHTETLVLPDSLGILAGYTFGRCEVKDLILPISLNATWIDSCPAFDGVSGIEKVTFTPGTGYGFNYAAYEDMNCWYKHTPWFQCRDTLKEIVFEDGIKHIGSDAFRELYITSIVIPDSVESLDNHTFFQCRELKNVTLPITLDSTYSDKYPAFDQCDAVTTLRLTAGTTGIGFDYSGRTPFWCALGHQVNQITVDSGITYLGVHTFIHYAFYGEDGRLMRASAENLSGLVFTGESGVMHIAQHIPNETGNEVDNRCSENAVATDLSSVVRFCADARYL